ncbi:MAG: hypothetical protein JWN94_381 [Betaproteobacteria bacterium]|nr:hypothetical protein [Betaproteobacteria bacterium]
MKPILIDYADVLHAARTVDLDLAPEHVPGVTSYFQLIAGMAALVNEYPLADSDEHAAVFTPCSPPTPR